MPSPRLSVERGGNGLLALRRGERETRPGALLRRYIQRRLNKRARPINRTSVPQPPQRHDRQRLRLQVEVAARAEDPASPLEAWLAAELPGALTHDEARGRRVERSHER